MTPFEALKKAVSVLGGQTAFANACGGKVKQQHVYNWLTRDKRLPDRYGLIIQQATSEKSPDETVWACELCPETFPEHLVGKFHPDQENSAA